jgi:hypothetical protein
MKHKFIISLFLILFVDFAFSLDINLNTGIILKGHFEAGLNHDIYFTIDFPHEFTINNSSEIPRRFKIVSDYWDDFTEYYGFESETESMTNYPFFILGKFILENPSDKSSQILLKIDDMVLEYDENDYGERGLDFENTHDYIVNDIIVNGELFYMNKYFPDFYMTIYGKIVGIYINTYFIENFKEIFENNHFAKINGWFTLRWMGRGNGTMYDEESDYSYRTNYGLYSIRDYKENK